MAAKKVPQLKRARSAAVPPEARRQRIVLAAVAEFARSGYAAASTNAIAQEAGVAKGLVFHHFENKEVLFTAAFEHVMAVTVAAIFDGLGELPPDLFDRLLVIGLRKMQLFQKDPDGYRFMAVALTEAPVRLRDALVRKQMESTAQHWPHVMDGIDGSRLAPGVTVQDALQTISMLMEGFERSVMPSLARLPDRGASRLEALGESARVHLHRLRDGLYKR